MIYGDLDNFEHSGDTMECADLEMSKLAKAKREGRMTYVNLAVTVIERLSKPACDTCLDQKEISETQSEGFRAMVACPDCSPSTEEMSNSFCEHCFTSDHDASVCPFVRIAA